MPQSEEIWRKASILAIAGGLAFWAATFAVSLTPIATEYRDALSISYLLMIVAALIGGLIIGFFFSYFLLRFFDKIPTNNPILKSVILSFIVIIIVTILLEGPSHFLTPTSDALRHFLIGTLFNVLRILALGIVIGYLYERLYNGFNPSVIASKSPQVE
ncbi:MAG: hypothetical protein ACTSUZ_12025 [Candidatus Thorarchaeota archaeon]